MKLVINNDKTNHNLHIFKDLAEGNSLVHRAMLSHCADEECLLFSYGYKGKDYMAEVTEKNKQYAVVITETFPEDDKVVATFAADIFFKYLDRLADDVTIYGMGA